MVSEWYLRATSGPGIFSWISLWIFMPNILQSELTGLQPSPHPPLPPFVDGVSIPLNHSLELEPLGVMPDSSRCLLLIDETPIPGNYSLNGAQESHLLPILTAPP